MSQRESITVRLESFEGPLDLLLYLIQSHAFDITKISLTKITDQYLSYVRLMQELNFDVASEFLVMAATLIFWKSKSILPQDPSELAVGADEDFGLTQEDLIRQLLEHQRFRAMGEDLAQLPRLGEDVFTRLNLKPPVEKVWREMDISGLAVSYQEMLVRARKRTQILKKETVSLSDKLASFADRLELGKMTEMSALITDLGSRPEIVVTFLASLELSRLKKLRVHQEKTYSTIYLELIETLKGFDPRLASGFAAEILAASAPPFHATPEVTPV